MIEIIFLRGAQPIVHYKTNELPDGKALESNQNSKLTNHKRPSPNPSQHLHHTPSHPYTIMKMQIVYDSPPSSAPTLKQAIQCPSAPGKYRFAKGVDSNGSDPMFFPSSSSVFGLSTCATESTFDTSIDSILESFNLPAGVFALKPDKPGRSETQTLRRKKLSISDVNGDIPPLPYKTVQTKSSSRKGSVLDKKQTQAISGSSSKADPGPMRRMSIKHLGPRRRSLIARGA